MQITENSTLQEMITETGLIKNDIGSCESSAREILTKNNISYKETDKLNTLISKFNDIEVGSSDFEIVEGDVPECVITEEKEKTFTINTNLGFIPKMIILYIDGYIYIDGKMHSSECSIIYNNDMHKYKSQFVYDSEPSNLKIIFISIEKITENNFNIKIEKSTVYKPTDNNKTTGIYKCAKWYAIK